MKRFFIKFSYIGTQYRGAERNISNRLMRDVDSIQGALETAFSQLLPRLECIPKVKLSSRTDAGVHALCSAGHVDLIPKNPAVSYIPHAILQSVNRYLKHGRHQIRLLDAIPVTPEFNARYLAKSRTYVYKLMVPKCTENYKAPIIDLEHCYHFRSNFDAERIQKATELFVGLKDFRTFSPRTDNSTKYVRRLDVFKLQKGFSLFPYDPLSENYDYWDLICKAPGFVYNQVRRMVSALLQLGVNNFTEKDIQVMLQVPNHQNWISKIIVIPPHGLHLLNVEYDEEEVKKYIINDPGSTENEFRLNSAEAELLKIRVA